MERNNRSEETSADLILSQLQTIAHNTELEIQEVINQMSELSDEQLAELLQEPGCLEKLTTIPEAPEFKVVLLILPMLPVALFFDMKKYGNEPLAWGVAIIWMLLIAYYVNQSLQNKMTPEIADQMIDEPKIQRILGKTAVDPQFYKTFKSARSRMLEKRKGKTKKNDWMTSSANLIQAGDERDRRTMSAGENPQQSELPSSKK